MKTLKKIFAAIIAVSFCSGILTSCDPDDVDDFAKGYREGYYWTRSGVANTDSNDVEVFSECPDAE